MVNTQNKVSTMSATKESAKGTVVIRYSAIVGNVS